MGLAEWLNNLLNPGKKPAPTPVPAPKPAPSPPVTAPGQIKPADLVAAINRVRVSHGLVRLVESPTLSAQALAHSRPMSQSGSLNHDGFAGRVAATFPNTAAGENVEMNSFKSADDCAAQWMGDEAHKANMLGNWDTVGVGIAVDGKGRNWITADFDRSRP